MFFFSFSTSLFVFSHFDHLMIFQLTKKERRRNFNGKRRRELINMMMYHRILPQFIYTRTHSYTLENILNKYWWIITMLSWRWWAANEMHIEFFLFYTDSFHSKIFWNDCCLFFCLFILFTGKCFHNVHYLIHSLFEVPK